MKVILSAVVACWMALSALANPALEVPWLSTYYIQPQVTVKEDVKISFYVTDWWQSEYRFGDTRHLFGVRLRIWPKDGSRDKARVWTKKKIKAGDHTFNIGKFDEGEYIVELSAIDAKKRKSPVLFHEFRVKKDFAISEKETYRMTADDLKTYGISNQGDVGIIRFIDATGKNEKETAALVAEEAAKVTAPSGKYVVIAGGEKYDPEANKNHRGAKNAPEPEWLPNPYSWRSCKVVYASDYDKDLVATNALKTSVGINKFLNDVREKGYRQVVFLPGTYRMANAQKILIPSGLTVDLNGATIKLNQFTGASGEQILMRNCVDSHVINGIVEGDYFEHDYANSPNHSEWVMGIAIDGESKYSSYERLLVRYITGYGTGNGFHGNRGKYAPTKNFTTGTIDEKTGKDLPNVKDLVISAMEDITPFVKDGGYLACSRWLGYQGMIGHDWSLRFHFYDKAGKYMETIYGRQYRIVRIPEGAEKVRVTVYASDPKAVGGLILNYFRRPWNSWFENIFILSARCVGMAPSAMYNFRFANCSFARSGENLAKCAFDAEDGWDMMQDVWIVRNKFFKNPVNELLTCAGHNFIIEDNECRMHLWSRTNGYVVRDNLFSGAFCGVAPARARTGLVRVMNNTVTGGLMLGDREGGAVDPSLAAVNPDQWVKTATKEKPSMPWFATLKDYEMAKSVSLGANALLAGITLKDKTLGKMTLAYSTIENCKFDNWLGTSSFHKCKLINVTGRATWNNTLTVTDGEVEGCTIDIMHGNATKGAVAIKNTKFKDTAFTIGYWIQPQKVTFENCTFENATKPIIRTGVYSIGEFVFKNCTFKNADAAVVQIYDMRKRHEQDGAIRFENCTFEPGKKCPVTLAARVNDGSQKKITLTTKGNKLKGQWMNAKVDWWIYED